MIDFKNITLIKDIQLRTGLFKPKKEKAAAIKIVNILIRDFNEMFNFLYNKSLIMQVEFLQKLEEYIQESLPGHRDYLIKYLHNAKHDIGVESTRIILNIRNDFLIFIKSLTTNKKNTLDSIKKQIFNWYQNQNKLINDTKNLLKKSSDESIDIFTKLIESKVVPKQNKKIEKLKTMTNQWTEYVKKQYNVNQTYTHSIKARRVISSFENLQEILNNRHGKLNPKLNDSGYVITRIFGKNRNWVKFEANEKIKYPPIGNSDNFTNGIVLGLLGVITDNGTDAKQLIDIYIK